MTDAVSGPLTTSALHPGMSGAYRPCRRAAAAALLLAVLSGVAPAAPAPVKGPVIVLRGIQPEAGRRIVLEAGDGRQVRRRRRARGWVAAGRGQEQGGGRRGPGWRRRVGRLGPAQHDHRPLHRRPASGWIPRRGSWAWSCAAAAPSAAPPAPRPATSAALPTRPTSATPPGGSASPTARKAPLRRSDSRLASFSLAARLSRRRLSR